MYPALMVNRSLSILSHILLHGISFLRSLLLFHCSPRVFLMASSHSSSDTTANSGNLFAPLSPGAPPPAATIALLNIHGHVPVTLDMNAANFR